MCLCSCYVQNILNSTRGMHLMNITTFECFHLTHMLQDPKKGRGIWDGRRKLSFKEIMGIKGSEINEGDSLAACMCSLKESIGPALALFGEGENIWHCSDLMSRYHKIHPNSSGLVFWFFCTGNKHFRRRAFCCLPHFSQGVFSLVFF